MQLNHNTKLVELVDRCEQGGPCCAGYGKIATDAW